MSNSKTRFLWLFVLLSFFQLIGQITTSVDEDAQKKQAEQYFQDEEYGQAYKLYTTLLANYPKDPKYNYRIGVCILFVGDERGDRKNAISYLEFAKKFVSDLDKEVIFYLGKAYHLTYRFDDAIRTYTEYKGIGSASNQRKLKVDREIESAKNGKKLLSRIKELVVLEKKRLNAADYFKSYDQRFYGGNLIVKPDQFVLPGDKKKKDKFILFQSKDRNIVLFSSYGQSGEHGKDIYISRRLPDGNFDVPVPVPGFVNTDYDEDYPYLHPNGKDLFFCSKGHTSMGGYDIFKSHWSEANKSWGRPENMNFPINTPYDDIQFVSDSSEQLAIFSSARISEFGKIDVYKIKVEPRSSQFALIKGSVMQKTQGASVMSRITIKDMEGNENVGNFMADDKGGYNLKLPNGGKFIFTVETPGFATQSEGVTVPASFDIRPLRQLITYESNKLIIQNFFDDKDDEQSYEDLRTQLLERQNMNINADKFTATDPVVKNTNPEVKNDNKNPDESVKKNITNAELVQMAKKDLEETNKEASDLKVQSDNATNMAVNIDNIADKKEQEANDAMNAAKNISNQKDKETALEIAADKKKEADNTRELAIKAQNIAAKLKVEADNKAKEAKLQEQFVRNMEDVNKSPTNKEKLAALEKTEKELRDLQEKSKADENNDLTNTTNAEIEQKQTELANLKKQEDVAKRDITQIDSEIKDKQEELKVTKEKDLKENINAELVNLEAEKKEKEKTLSDTKKKITSTQNYIENKQSESNFEKTLLSQAKVGNTDVTDLVAKNVAPVNETKNDSQNQVTDNGQNTNNQVKNEGNKTDEIYAEKENKIKEELTNIGSNEKSKENLEKKVEIIKAWNNALDEKIAADKEELKTTKDNARKEEIKKEIKLAEDKKKENTANINLAVKEAKTAPTDVQIAAAKNTETNSATTDSAQNANKTFEKKEDAVKTQLSNFNAAEKTKENLDKKVEVLQDYNKTIDEQIAADKNELKKEKDPEKKKEINAEIKRLEATKKENLTAIATATKDKKTAPTDAEVAAKNNSTNNQLTDNGQGGNQNKSPNSNQKADSTKDSGQNKNPNTNLIVDNSQNGNQNENKNPNTNVLNDNSQGGNENKSPNTNVNNVTNDNSSVQASIDQKNNLADDLQAQAKQKRNDAKTKTGEEKKKLLAEATELDKKSKDQRVEAIAEEVVLREKQSEENKKVIEELKELSKDQKGSDIIQATKLEGEIKSLMTKAGKMRDEANKEKDPNAKIGGLTNADETERQAILKQKEVIAIYEKRNPDYVANKTQNNNPNGNQLADNGQGGNENPNTNKSPNGNQLTDNGQNGNQNTTENKNPNGNQLADNGQGGNQNTNTNKSPNGNQLTDNGQNGNQNTNTNKSPNGNQLADNGQSGNQNINENKNPNGNQLADNGQGGNQNTNKSPNGNQLNGNENAANLSPQKVEAIKSSPEYKKYESYSKKADEAMANVKRDEDQAKIYISKATEQLKQSNDLRIKADGMPEGEEKNNTRKKAIELEHQAMADKSKSDSLNELASNTRAYAIEQQQQADNYASTLDQKTQNDIAAVGGSRTKITNSNPGNATTTNSGSGSNSGYTDNFKNTADKNDKEIESFKTVEKNEQNLSAQNIVVKNYIRDIEKEIIDQRKKLEAAKSPEEKSRIEGLLADLKIKRKEMKDLLVANERELKKVKADAIANNNNRNPNGNQGTTNDNASGNANTVIASSGLKVNDNNVYNSANPIPIDQKWPEGIIYTVQIGAFKTAVPNDIFRGLNPIVGTTAPSGFIRYQAGKFSKFSEANAAKNDVRKLGFKDAFVAVYKNGLRIPLSQAQQESGDNIVADNNTTLGITLGTNTPNGNNIIPDNSQVGSNVIATETAQVNGLFYTVQIGVYGNSVPASKLYNLSPINRELIPSGSYRYSAGVYSNLDRVKSDRQKVNELGIKDAFVTVYHNGKRITFNEASQIQNAGNVQFSTEKPIRFPNGGTSTTATENSVVVGENITANTNTTTAVNEVQPFSNGVVNDPVATPENGVKLTTEGIVYKVQLGAYSKQVPDNVSQNWMKVKTWPIRNYVRNSLYIYTMGSFGDFANANKLLAEAKTLGMTDAFITVFKDGNRLGFAEAIPYMK